MLLFNLRQIVQIVDSTEVEFLVNDEMSQIKVLESEEANLAVHVKGGRVSKIGTYSELQSAANFEHQNDKELIDCKGGCLLPGLVDGHSHPVFAGDRVNEFAMKLAGATYMEVQAAGGGIHFTTNKTREASAEELLKSFEKTAQEMVQLGTTLLEAKSGYGLDESTELKMLQVLDEANKKGPLEISATFCGAHAIPKDSTEEDQTDLIVKKIVPAIEKSQKNGQLQSLENIDVFCEKGVFELNSTRKILQAGLSIGLKPNIHADELFPLKGSELAADMKAAAASHLEEISDEGIQALASSGTVAVLLPTTAYILRLKPPPARKMIQNNVIVALGSDFNPNAPCLNMGLVMHLACITLKLSMPEALVAATLNAAHSLGRGKTHGAISINRVADFIVLDTPRWEHFIYRVGSQHSIICFVIKRGKVVYSRDRVL